MQFRVLWKADFKARFSLVSSMNQGAGKHASALIHVTEPKFSEGITEGKCRQCHNWGSGTSLHSPKSSGVRFGQMATVLSTGWELFVALFPGASSFPKPTPVIFCILNITLQNGIATEMPNTHCVPLNQRSRICFWLKHEGNLEVTLKIPSVPRKIK